MPAILKREMKVLDDNVSRKRRIEAEAPLNEQRKKGRRKANESAQHGLVEPKMFSIGKAVASKAIYTQPASDNHP